LESVFVQIYKREKCENEIRHGLARGFTLLEIMVAVAILGISLVVIMQLFSMGLKSAQIEKDYSQAIFLARAKMGEVMTQAEVKESTDSGTFESGFEWESKIEPFERPKPEGGEGLKMEPSTQTGLEEKERFKLFSVTVVVSWSGGGTEGGQKKVELDSLRLVKTEEDEATAGPPPSEPAPPPQ
jgi:prepilin-type N-terminal cleavage/methylation domain-containing protein